MTYRPILATNCLAHFHHSLMRIESYGMSGSSYGMGSSSYGMGVSCYCMGIGCYGVCVQSQLGLRSKGLVTIKQGHNQQTLKTRRIPSSSNLQPAIFPLRLLAVKYLMSSFFLADLSIFCCIS